MRVRLSSDKDADASFVIYRYRAPLADTTAAKAPDSSADASLERASQSDAGSGALGDTPSAVRLLVGNDEGGMVVDVGLIPVVAVQPATDEGARGGMHGGGLGSSLDTSMRCLFGTVAVALRSAVGLNPKP